MKKLLILLALPLFLFACSADIWFDDVRVEKDESRDFSARQIYRVEANTKNGNIESRVSNDNSIHVTLEKWATGVDSSDATDNLRDIRVFYIEDTDAGVLTIDVDYPSRIGTRYGCDIIISLPASIDLNLEASNGDIEITDSQSNMMCHTSNGSITVRNTEGNATLRTSNGKIFVRNHHGGIDAKTSNGEIAADVVLPKRGDCTLKTSNGSIVLSVPNSASATLQASTSNGKVEINNLDVTVINMKKTEFKGIMGDGDGRIDLETSNGGIVVKRSL